MTSAAMLVLINLVVGIGSLLQGAIGFGLGLFSVPFLALLNPELVPGPILFASGCLTVSMVARERHAVRVADLKWSLGGRVFGTLGAMAVLVLVPPSELGLVFGVLVLAAVLLSATGWRIAVSPRTLSTAGALSGFLGTAVSIGGPPVALLYQRESGPSVRATLSAFFSAGTVLSLGGLHLVGRFGAREALLGLAMLPGIGIGFLLSKRAAHVLDQGRIRPAILLVSGLAGALLLVKTFW